MRQTSSQSSITTSSSEEEEEDVEVVVVVRSSQKRRRVKYGRLEEPDIAERMAEDYVDGGKGNSP
jgi:hypothetical protein